MSRRGSSLIEAVLVLPVLFFLFVAMAEMARVTYTYVMIQKILTNLAKDVGTRQGVNFCAEDANVTSAINWALTGSTEGGSDPLVPNLTADNILIWIERVDTAGELGECECSSTGCDAAAAGRSPDFVVVSLADGYTVRLAVPFVNFEPFILRPQVRMPYRGT
jgi:hypothetical protein